MCQKNRFFIMFQNYSTLISLITIIGICGCGKNNKDTVPDFFSFHAQTGITRNTVVTSNQITVSGISADSTADISISGADGTYSINNGNYTNSAGTVSAGDTVSIKLTSSSDYNTATATTLNIGGVAGSFNVTTEPNGSPTDTTPDPFTFTTQSGVAISTVVTSNEITISGINSATAISISGDGGTYSINGEAYKNTADTVKLGDKITVRVTASPINNTAVSVLLNIGDVSGSFNVTTEGGGSSTDIIPDTFTFNAITGVTINTISTSNEITVSGINTAASISITGSGGIYSINGANYTSVAGAVNNGDKVTIRLTSSASYNKTVSTTLNIGGITSSFIVATEIEGSPTDITPDAFIFKSQTGVAISSAITSNQIIVSGINAGTPISISGEDGAYSINDGDYTKAAGTLKNGDKVTIRVTSSSMNNTAVSVLLNIGNVIGSFNVITIKKTNVSHLAGPLGGPGITDSIGSDARFNQPTEIASDGNNLYVSDTNNHTIRKIVIGTGVVSTLAGCAGSPGSTDGPDSTARFNCPRGIILNGETLLVADAGNNTIRQIVISTGLVTTIAGSAGNKGTADGIGDDARFHYPTGLTVVDGNLYVADYMNNSIRQVNLSTRVVTTIAFPGSELDIEIGGMLNCTPGNGLTTDGIYLYVTEPTAIKKVCISTGLVTTLRCVDAVSGSDIDIWGLNGITTDGSYLYITEKCTNIIRKIDKLSGVATIFSGIEFLSGSTDGISSDAQFNAPHGIILVGNTFYLTDSGNHNIRKINKTTEFVETLSGEACGFGSIDGIGDKARFYRPNGITIVNGNLYIADTKNSTIRQIVIATGAVTTFAGQAGQRGSNDGIGTNARFNYPEGITTDGVNLYVADTGNYTIRKIVISNGEVSTLFDPTNIDGSAAEVGAMGNYKFPFGITTDGTRLYITDTWNYKVKIFDLKTGIVTTLAGSGLSGSADGIGEEAQFNFPAGITTDGTNLYVNDVANCTVRKIVIKTGAVTTIAGIVGHKGSTDGAASDAMFNYPAGITTDGTNLYVADTDNHTIRKIVIETGIVTTLAGQAGIFGSDDGNLLDLRFFFPFGIVYDQSSKEIFVSEHGNHAIRRITQ